MSRAVGVHKSIEDKAWEQYERQKVKVEKMTNKVLAMQVELEHLNEQINSEAELLAYYAAHPAVKHQLDVEDDKNQPMLPLELKDASKERKYQALGIGGRFVEE